MILVIFGCARCACGGGWGTRRSRRVEEVDDNRRTLSSLVILKVPLIASNCAARNTQALVEVPRSATYPHELTSYSLLEFSMEL